MREWERNGMMDRKHSPSNFFLSLQHHLSSLQSNSSLQFPQFSSIPLHSHPQHTSKCSWKFSPAFKGYFFTFSLGSFFLKRKGCSHFEIHVKTVFPPLLTPFLTPNCSFIVRQMTLSWRVPPIKRPSCLSVTNPNPPNFHSWVTSLILDTGIFSWGCIQKEETFLLLRISKVKFITFCKRQ